MILATALLAALLSNPFAPKPKAAPAAPAPAAAAAPAPVPDIPPRGFPGYAHPEVTASMCKVINTGKTQCMLPGMTAGRYVIEAVGVSTALPSAPAPAPAPARGGAAPATPQGAVQAIAIFTGDRLCGRVQSQPWTTSGAHPIRLTCEITVVADAPFPITVSYADANATPDPRGPGIVVRRLPWDGVITAQAFVPQP